MEISRFRNGNLISNSTIIFMDWIYHMGTLKRTKSVAMRHRFISEAHIHIHRTNLFICLFRLDFLSKFITNLDFWPHFLHWFLCFSDKMALHRNPFRCLLLQIQIHFGMAWRIEPESWIFKRKFEWKPLFCIPVSLILFPSRCHFFYGSLCGLCVIDVIGQAIDSVGESKCFRIW